MSHFKQEGRPSALRGPLRSDMLFWQHCRRCDVDSLCDSQCYSPLIARLVTALPTANATQAQAPAPPVSPCRSANGTVEGTRDIPATQLSPDVEGTRDIPAAQLSPDAASAAPRPASTPAVPTPAAAADRPPPADLFGALRGFFPDGTGGVTLSRAEAMAARSRTMIAAAPDPDCPLC